MKAEYVQHYIEIFNQEYSRLARLWLRRDRYTPYSKKWLRYDKQINDSIEKGNRRFIKANCFVADWHVRSHFFFLEQQQ